MASRQWLALELLDVMQPIPARFPRIYIQSASIPQSILWGAVSLLILWGQYRVRLSVANASVLPQLRPVSCAPVNHCIAMATFAMLSCCHGAEH